MKYLPRRWTYPPIANNSGGIFILTLWAIFFLSTLAVMLGYQIRQKLTLLGRIEERDKLRYVAEAGVRKTICDILKDKERLRYALKDCVEGELALFKEVAFGDGVYDISYEYPDDQTGSLKTYYGPLDEERKININKASMPVMRRFFRYLLAIDEVEAQDVAASIVDWRDSDSDLSVPLGSAEDSYYRNLPVPYEAKDANFETLSELLLVKGVTPKIFERVKPYLTIYGDGRVNVNTAPKAVLAAFGLPESAVDKILAYRRGRDGVDGTTDDNVFQAAGDIAGLGGDFRLTDAESAKAREVCEQYLTVNSYNFMIRSAASLKNKKYKVEAVGVVDNNGKILSWQET